MHRSTALSSPPVKKSPLLISRQYALLWSGQAVSRLGDAIFQTTVVLWIATRLGAGASWAPLAVSAVILAGEAPQIAVGPIAGVFVDRWDKRRTMLAMDAIRAGLLVLLVAAAGSETFPSVLHFRLSTGFLLGAIYGTIVLIVGASQFFGPARLVVIGDIVPDELRERASGLAQTSSAVTSIVGPALAAPLFFAAGVGLALTLDAISFVVSFVVIFLVRPHAVAHPVRVHQAGSVLRELSQGIGVVFSVRMLRTVLVTGVLISVGLGALDVLSVFFLRQNLHAAASLYGLLGGALGVGGLCGAIVGGPLAERMGVARLLPAVALIMGILFLLFSRLTAFLPALVVLFLIGASFAVLEVSETPLLLRSTPREYLGRVTALLTPMYAVGAAVSALAAGWLVSTVLRGVHVSIGGMALGPVDTMLGIGGVFVIVGALYAGANMGERQLH